MTPTSLDNSDIQPMECIREFSRKGTAFFFVSDVDQPCNIKLPLFYYSGYEARTADGMELPVSQVDQHRLQVLVPAGVNEVTVQYVGKDSWRNLGIISLFGTLVFFVFVLKERHNR